ncbi:metallophosphoesterase family protein [Kroppenstedtia eburnea]|uniref:metallophosphoesterase family protein n=1 Tax=Kroppenstedtia eburnea TaxID=714067 RepID=UPI0036320E0B
MIIRIAAISDIHGNGVAFEAVWNDLRTTSPDLIFSLGDVVQRGPQPKECLDMLKALSPSVMLRGNHEHLLTRFPQPGQKPGSFKEKLAYRSIRYDKRWLSSEELQWLANLPLTRKPVLEGIQIECFHATPDSLTDVVWPWASMEELDTMRSCDRTHLVMYGHVHHAFIRQARDFTVVNTGSVGLPFDGDPRASYALIDLHGKDASVQLRRVDYDREKAIQIAVDRSMPDVELFAEGLRTARYPYFQKVKR